MYIGTKIADAVQRRSRGMRDERHIGRTQAHPRRRIGLELKPRRPQREMVRLRSPTYPVDTVRDAFEQPVTGEARKRTRAYAGLLCLLTRA